MYLFEWCYSHILRSTGVSAIGVREISDIEKESANNDVELQEITKKENEYLLQVIKRIFILTHNYTKNKIKALERNKHKNKVASLLEKLEEIKNDCEKIIAEFEKK